MENLLCTGTMVREQSPFLMGLTVGHTDSILMHQYMREPDKFNKKKMK